MKLLAVLPLLLGLPLLSAAPQDAPSSRPAQRADAPAAKRPEPNYVHPLGFAARHPKRWRVEETVLGLSLLPPDLARGAQMPRELYLMNAAAMPADVKTLDDPRVASRLKDLMKQSLPFLRPLGKPKQVAGVPGAREFRWGGTEPTTNTKLVAWVRVRVENGFSLSLSAIGEPALVERRGQELSGIFRSLQAGEPKTDAKLVGTWNADAHHSVGDISSDRINISHRQTVTLRPDGRMVSASQMGVGGRTGGHDRPGTDVSGVVQGEPGLGRWAAEGRYLYVLWNEGAVAKFEVYVQGTPGPARDAADAGRRRSEGALDRVLAAPSRSARCRSAAGCWPPSTSSRRGPR